MKEPVLPWLRKKRLMELAFLMNRQNKLPIPVTGPLLDCFDLVITPQECGFLLRMGRRAQTRQELFTASGLDAASFETLLSSCLKKGLVWQTGKPGEHIRYILASILVGWFELQLCKGLETPEEQEFARRLNRMFESIRKINFTPVRQIMNFLVRRYTPPFQSVAPVDPEQRAPMRRRVMVNAPVKYEGTKIYTSEMVHRLIEQYGDENSIAAMHWFCRQWRKMAGEPCRLGVPSDVCIVVGGFGRNVA
jgi:hypothetical protein